MYNNVLIRVILNSDIFGIWERTQLKILYTAKITTNIKVKPKLI